MIDDQLAAHVLAQPAGNFDGADIILNPMVGAGFADENFVAGPQSIDGFGAAHHRFQIALVAGK